MPVVPCTNEGVPNKRDLKQLLTLAILTNLEGESTKDLVVEVLKWHQVTCIWIPTHKTSQNAEGEKPIIQPSNGLSENRQDTLERLYNSSCYVYSVWH